MVLFLLYITPFVFYMLLCPDLCVKWIKQVSFHLITFIDLLIRTCRILLMSSLKHAGLQDDKFTQSKCIRHQLHSNTDKILLLNHNGEFQAQMLSKQEQEQAGNTFIFFHLHSIQKTIFVPGGQLHTFVSG